MTPAPDDGGTVGPPDLGEPTRIFLVRHGATAMNSTGQVTGRAGLNPALSREGRRDAVRVARRLATLTTYGHAAVVTSSLLRARQTGELIAATIGATAHPDERWDEQAAGEWDGLTWSQIAARNPKAHGLTRSDDYFCPPGGESFAAMRDRVLDAWRALTHQAGTVVVVTHRGPLDVILAHLLHMPRSSAARLSVEPGSLTPVRRWRDGGLLIDSVNDTAHLREIATEVSGGGATD